MFKLTDLIIKQLAKRNIAKLSLGSFVLAILKSKVGLKDKVISGYLKNNILFVKILDIHTKTYVYLHKQSILTDINNKIKDFGYSYIVKDIIFK